MQACLESGQVDPNYEVVCVCIVCMLYYLVFTRMLQVSGWNVLMCAAKHKQTQIIQLLTTFGAEIDAQDKVSVQCQNITSQISS